MVSCVLLSAGLSTRFGSPKALAKLNGDLVIERLLRELLATQIDEIVVVLGAQAEKIKPYLLNHKKVKVVYNKDYKFGQTSSFKAAFPSLSLESRSVMLLPVDYPLIKKDTINYLISQYEGKKAPVLIPTYQNKKGHPPVFSLDLKEEFVRLDNSVGVNEVIHRHQGDTILLPVEDEGVVTTFNTPEEFFILRKSFKDFL